MAERKSVEETKTALHDVVREMYDRIVKGEPPTMTLPVRTKNNIGFDPKLGVYKYGKKQTIRVHMAVYVVFLKYVTQNKMHHDVKL